jgi:ABC-type polysaccharide/polyol phosphate transport system ATPase subunit
MIEVRNVYKRYRDNHDSDWVLRDIDFTLEKGISVGLVGRNGAGKSTLLRLIGGMDAPDRGEIIRRCRVSWPLGLSVGFEGSMTGRQNFCTSRVQAFCSSAVPLRCCWAKATFDETDIDNKMRARRDLRIVFLHSAA